MTEYQNTKYDFKKYLLDNLNDAHQDELIFWKKSIPLPIDLVYKIFDESQELIGKYCVHILSLAVMECYYSAKKIDFIQLNELPSSQIFKSINASIIFKEYSEHKKIQAIRGLLRSTFHLKELAFDELDFINSISHDGRKYRRLYVPKELKNSISKIIPVLNDAVGVSNGDMFGNIVADYLKIYRSGFSDAFAAIFNKLIDFHLQFSHDFKDTYGNHQKIKISQVSDFISENMTCIEKILDGALWEPAYINAKIVMRINQNHPYWNLVSANKISSVKVFQDILSKLSCMEFESVKESNKKYLENLRYEISRGLRVSAETYN